MPIAEPMMKQVLVGKAVTVGTIRDFLAKANAVDFTNPITAGIFEKNYIAAQGLERQGCRKGCHRGQTGMERTSCVPRSNLCSVMVVLVWGIFT